MNTQKAENIKRLLDIGVNCFRYSDNAEKLKGILADVEIYAEQIEREKSTFAFNKPGINSNRYNWKYNIIVIRDKKTIAFEFHDSISNYKNNKSPDAYRILCCMKNDGLTDVSSFDNFCREFGFNNDSIKDKACYDSCIEQWFKVHRLFTDEELECLPSEQINKE